MPAGYSRSVALIIGFLQLSIVLLLAANSLGPTGSHAEGTSVLTLFLMVAVAVTLFARLLVTSFRERLTAE